MLSGLGFGLSPQLIGSQEQRDIAWVLEVCLADDAGPTVAGSAFVRGSELLESEHPYATPGKLPDGGASHSSETEDDDLISVHLGNQSLIQQKQTKETKRRHLAALPMPPNRER